MADSRAAMEVAMGNEIDAGRSDLSQFDAEQPENFWRVDPHLQRVLGYRAGEKRLADWRKRLDQFGGECAGPIDLAVRRNNLNHNLPTLERFSGFGERLEEVEHHPSFHLAGRAIYGSGMMSAIAERGGNLLALALFYLSSHNGEAGHNCPLACTAGVIKSLREVASPELRDRYMPRLLSTDYPTLAHGGQFLTEVQGGSDVGANAVRAVPEEEQAGTWRLHGEKWFCSNVTADLVMVTARPEGSGDGTAGLGLFFMPRRLPDGSLNAYSIRRLKDKIGTRSLPTAEVDLNGALAWAVGPVEHGFRNMMTWVINTSRMFNAVACCGIAHRAFLVAHGYANRRRAFGDSISSYPLVQESLADMRAESAAMLSGTFQLVAMLDRIERGEAEEAERAAWRFGINLNKRRTALSSHEIALSGVEMLAGNGTIETFSVMPRLLRDNVVFENWEGSHNTLLMQLLRDCESKKMHQPFFAQLEQQVEGHSRLAEQVASTRTDFDAMLSGGPAEASLLMRPLADRLSWLQWASAMHEEGADKTLLEHFIDRRLGRPAPRDASYLKRIASIAEGP